mgnify:CR=1 FL=1
METRFYCSSSDCIKRNECLRAKKENIDLEIWIELGHETEIIGEDLLSICGGTELFEVAEPVSFTESKQDLMELMNFYHSCNQEKECPYAKAYIDITTNLESRISCKLGGNYTCKNPSHPIMKLINEHLSSVFSGIKALEGAGTGEEVNYTCPVCKETARAIKHEDGIVIKCPKCDMGAIS